MPNIWMQFQVESTLFPRICRVSIQGVVSDDIQLVIIYHWIRTKESFSLVGTFYIIQLLSGLDIKNIQHILTVYEIRISAFLRNIPRSIIIKQIFDFPVFLVIADSGIDGTFHQDVIEEQYILASIRTHIITLPDCFTCFEIDSHHGPVYIRVYGVALKKTMGRN